MIKIDSFIVNKGSNSSSSNGGGGFANTVTVQKKLEKHKLWGQEFDGTQDVDGDMTINGNVAISGNVKATNGNITNVNSTTINNSGNIVNGGNITNNGNLKTTNATVDNDLTVTNNANVTNDLTVGNSATVDNDLTVGNSATVGTINSTTGNITTIKSNNITNNDTIKTKNLSVTGTAHFFNLIIDKIKSAGGAALFTPADSFDVDIVQDSQNEVKLLWQCQDEDGKQRDNMWKVNDQALCMSFNQAKVGTTHNVANKYYWALVTSVNTVNEPAVIDGVKYNYITLSKTVVDGVLNPEFGDSIVMCGYRGTDDAARQSAIYISAYSSLDKGLTAPLFAQYQGINDFNLESHRKSYYDANRAKFVGEFEATDGQNIINIIDNKIAESEASIKLNTKNIVLSVSEKTKERRNLLVGSDFKRKGNDFIISTDARIEMNSGYNGTNCIHVIDSTEAGNPHYVGVYWDGSQGGRSVKIEKGKKYTISCFYKTNDSNAKFSLEAIYTDKETNGNRIRQATYLSPSSFNPKYNQWQLFTTIIDTTDAESDYIAFNFWEACNINAGRINAYICRPMVEEGDTYYGWTLSKEDYDYIGGNILDNSRTFDVGGNILSVTGNKTLVGDVYELTASGSNDYNQLYRIKGDAFKLNTDYTLSFEVRGDAKYLQVNAFYPANNTKYTCYREQQNDLMYETAGDGTTVAYAILGEFEVLSNQQKVWVHFRFKDRLPEQIYFQFPKNSEQTGVTSWTVSISKIKIEEGANVTEWTEKKTDVENSITTITNNVATLTQKADSIESKVTSNTTNINNITGQLSSQSTSISKLEQKANSIESNVTSNTTTINSINGQVTSLQSDMSDVKQTASSITSTVSSMKDEILGANCMLGLNGQGWSSNTIYEDAGNSFHCESTDWFQSHPIMDFSGDYTFSFGLWNDNLQIKILDFTQTYYDDGIYDQYVDFGPYKPCKILTTIATVPNAALTNYATIGTSSNWTYTNSETITLKVGDNVAVRVTNGDNKRYNSIYGTVSAINTSSKSVTVQAIALLDQPNVISTLTCPADKKDGTDINSLHYDETLGRYWIRFKETRGTAKTFVMLFRNLSTSTIAWISRLMLEESVEYPHKYNNTGQASQSMIKQTANEILMSVNDTYLKIGDGNITLNGDTKVNGALTLTQTDQGFKLVGSDGITEIKPESIGTYDNFKAANTSTQNVVKAINVNGAKSDSDGILSFQGSLIIYLGDRKKGDFIKCKFNSLTADVTNAWDGSSFSKTFALSSSFSAKVMNQYNSAVIHNWNTVYSNREYSYTFDSDTTNARIYVTFSGNTLYSSWIGNYNVYQGGKPMPMPNATIKVNGTLELPMAAHMLIGYDGWGINFGNNKLVYCGKDGFMAKYGDNEFRITDAGISHNNMATTYTVIGTSSSSSPATYTVQDPIDTVLCKSGYCKVIFPSNPYNGQRIKIYDKSPQESYINSNGKYVCSADRRYSDRSIWTNQNLSNTAVRIYTFINDTWYEEYTG